MPAFVLPREKPDLQERAAQLAVEALWEREPPAQFEARSHLELYLIGCRPASEFVAVVDR